MKELKAQCDDFMKGSNVTMTTPPTSIVSPFAPSLEKVNDKNIIKTKKNPENFLIET